MRPVLGNTAPACLTGGLSEPELGHELGLSSAVLNPWTENSRLSWFGWDLAFSSITVSVPLQSVWTHTSGVLLCVCVRVCGVFFFFFFHRSTLVCSDKCDCNKSSRVKTAV